MNGENESIVLGGGCFWCVEAALREVPGIVEVTPGYAGGATPDPGYEEVCRGNTGHAEVVLVEYDPNEVSLEDLLGFFFSMHDPTSLNRQGNDVGTQYRSIILYDSDDQKKVVERFIEEVAERYDRPIVTEVKPLDRFYPAEEYHQRYFEKNPDLPYCRAVIAPKVDRIRRKPGHA